MYDYNYYLLLTLQQSLVFSQERDAIVASAAYKSDSICSTVLTASAALQSLQGEGEKQDVISSLVCRWGIMAQSVFPKTTQEACRARS